MMGPYTGLLGLAVFGIVLGVWGLIAARRERREHERSHKS